MRATVQIDKYNWQDESALYVFYIDFEIKPRKDDTVISLIEYEGRFAVVELQWLYEKELKNGLKVRGSFPAEQTWENVKGFRYLYEDELKLIGKKINELFEKNNVEN